MKPPFSYCGGKQYLAEYLLNLLPKHTTYVEPFCGSAALLFAKERSRLEVLNDKEDKIVNFFKVLRDQGKELQRVCKLTPYSQAEYQKALDGGGDDLERARKWWVRVSQSFASMPSDSWARFPSKKISVKASRLEQVAQRLSDVCLVCEDALDIISKYDSMKTCFYCDPPYPESEQKAYSNKFSVKAFNDLVTCLDQIQGSFLLSCYYKEGMQIPGDWESYRVKSSVRFRKLISPRTEIIFRKLNSQSGDMLLW